MTDVTNPDDEDVRSPAHPGPPAAKDPDEWVTGEEPTTGPQQSYLGTLARVADESVPTDLYQGASVGADRRTATAHRT